MTSSATDRPMIQLDVHNLEMYYDRPEPSATGGKATSQPGKGELDATVGERPFHLSIPRLRLRGGEMVGIAGRSGEGKSTLLYVLALLLRPPGLRVNYVYSYNSQARNFEYRLPEFNVTEGELERVRNEAFGFIFQSHFLLPYFDVADNVTLPVMVRPSFQREGLRQPIRQLLAELGLDERQHPKLPSQLSGGQNQRVAVARALLHEPPFLFADEPTANLDKHKREVVLRRLRAAADGGKCVVLVSHEIGDLAHYCDRILMVQENKLHRPFGGDPDETEGLVTAPSASENQTGENHNGKAERRTLPTLEKIDGRSSPRRRDDVVWITGEVSHLIWPVESQSSPASSTAKPGETAKPDAATIDAANAADPTRPKPTATPVKLTLPAQPDGPIAFRFHAFRYAWKEVFSSKQRWVRILVAALLMAGTGIFTFLSALGQGSVRYLSETTLNKPSEYLNRFTVRQPDPVKRLDPQHVEFLKTQVPGLKASPTLIQRIFQYQVYDVFGRRQVKNYAYSVPEGDEMLRAVPPEEADTAQIGVIYRAGGAFPLGQTDRGGVIVSRRWLRSVYWNLNDKVDDPKTPDQEFPKEIEFRLATGDGGVNEEELLKRYMPGVNGRVRLPVVGVFDYPKLVIRNTVGGENGLPSIFLPEQFLRRLGLKAVSEKEVEEGTAKAEAVWDWYHGFLARSVGDGEGDVLVKPYPVLRAIRLGVRDAKPKLAWSWKKATNWKRPLTWLEAALSPVGRKSDLLRDLQRPFSNTLVPGLETLPDGRQVAVLRLDKARQEPSQKLTKAKVLELEREKGYWEQWKLSLEEAAGGGTAFIEFEEQPITAILPERALPKLPDDEPRFVQAVMRLQTFRDVLPARKTVQTKYGDQLELEPKGGQVVALERFESISGVMQYANVGLKATFVIGLIFIIGITAYMHINGKTADIGILRAYGLSPISIAWVYGLELVLLVLPACLLGILGAYALSRAANDWVADAVVLTAGKPDADADDSAKTQAERDAIAAAKAAVEKPRVFSNLQQSPLANAADAGQTLLSALAIIAVVTTGAVFLIKRQQIVDCLRGGSA